MKIDRGAVMFGLVFLTVGASYLLEAFGVIDVRASYLLPVLLIVAGVALTLTALSREDPR